MYCIYLAKNEKNGKMYVGKTNDFERRKKEHIHSTSDHLFSRAIRKYGKQSFFWTILEDGIETKEDASKRERYFIKKYKTYFRWKNSSGYNMTKGGDGDSCWNVRRVASYSLDGKFLKEFETVSDAARFYKISGTTSISCVCNNRERSCGNTMFMYADEDGHFPLKIKPYVKKRSKRERAVVKLDLDGNVLKKYRSLSEASKDGACRTTISGCLSGEYKTAGGFLWCYEENLLDTIGRKAPDRIGRGVIQFTLDWEFVGEYENCAAAARANGLEGNSYKLIHGAINSKSHISKGFRWVAK